MTKPRQLHFCQLRKTLLHGSNDEIFRNINVKILLYYCGEITLEWQEVIVAIKLHGLRVSEYLHIISLVQLIQVGFRHADDI